MANLRPPVYTLTDAELAAELRLHAEIGNEGRLKACRTEAISRLPVRQLVGGGYVVQSRTTPGAWWLVEVHHTVRQAPATCTCPAEVARCHHVRQVENYCRLTDAMHARSTPAPNISALVD